MAIPCGDIKLILPDIATEKWIKEFSEIMSKELLYSHTFNSVFNTSIHTFEPRQTIYPPAIDEDARRQAQWKLHYAIPNILWKLNQEEEMKPEEKVKKFKFYYDDLEVATFCVMETNCRKIIGMTVCHPKDKRNDYMGRKMAFTDAVSKLAYHGEREKAWKKFFRKYPIPEDRKKFGEK